MWAMFLLPVGSCPDLAALRSPRVVSSFNDTSLTGFWYESAFIDVAQVGATCQTLNGSRAASGVVSMDFKVRYGPVPFTIIELYTPGMQAGLYTKRAKMPGGKLLELATAVVDVDPETLILFSCLDLVATHVQELVVATRTPAPASNVTDALLARARALGVPFTDTSVKRVDHSHCAR